MKKYYCTKKIHHKASKPSKFKVAFSKAFNFSKLKKEMLKMGII